MLQEQGNCRNRGKRCFFDGIMWGEEVQTWEEAGWWIPKGMCLSGFPLVMSLGGDTNLSLPTCLYCPSYSFDWKGLERVLAHYYLPHFIFQPRWRGWRYITRWGGAIIWHSFRHHKVMIQTRGNLSVFFNFVKCFQDNLVSHKTTTNKKILS